MGASVRRPPAGQTGRSEAVLLERIRAKDVDAFEELYRSYRTRLSPFLTKLVHRQQLIEEILNDTLMVVWQQAHAFNGDSKLSTWIFAIAYRKSMKALRSYQDPIEDRDAEGRISPDPSPEDELERAGTRALLLKAISELSPEHRAVVEYTYFHEMGYQQIAERLSCPVGTVKTRMFHARRQLRRRLAGEL
jgi:RNA polymerase sigma-70 factor (ECF subfamily)